MLCPDLPTRPGALSAHAQALLDALAGEVDQRLDVLRELIAQSLEAPTAAENWLTQRALLVVAADDIKREDFTRARQRLRKVPTASPAAVGAALLLAESFLLEGKPEQARQWYLRVGERFPSERTALQGVLSAGSTLEAKAPEAALALYQDVSKKAGDAAARLDTITSEIQQRPLAFLFTPTGDPSLRRQLLEQMARAEHSKTVEQERRKMANTAKLRCLLRKSRPLYHARADLESRLSGLDAQAGIARERISNLENQQETLEKQVRPGELTPEQKQIRKELMDIRNAIQRKKARLDFLEHNRERLPRLMSKLEGRIENLYEHFSNRKRLDGEAVRARLENALEEVRQDFLDIAGTARHRGARIMEGQALRDNLD